MTELHDPIITAEDYAWLPHYCPEWCAGGTDGHRQALEEGCTPTDASRHISEDMGGTIRPITAPLGGMSRAQRGGWHIDVKADHIGAGPETRGHVGLPMIDLQLHEWQQTGEASRDRLENLDLSITSGEARVLARQLLHLADRIDLHC